MRRKTIVSASAAARWLAGLGCLGALLTGCGGSDRDGYVATGAAGPGTSRSGVVPPTGGVRLMPLDGETGKPSSHGPRRSPSGTPGSPTSPASPASPQKTSRATPSVSTAGPYSPGSRIDTGGAWPGPTTAPGAPDGTGPASPAPPSSAPPTSRPRPSPSTGTPPGTPAVLDIGTPRREPDDERRWCEKVTVTFTNTGGQPVTGGTVTFGTHIVGPLGTDWVTLTSSEPLPVPIDPGQAREKTWTVCVDAWRVPPGMRVETRDVSVKWA
ncbi:hypothetical protein ACFZB6_14055 [Streptomyces syringium]|uniref:hypothetical protein n=1 Tax=Streptomyces syringium TaxID=76729 RepID=UPI0033AD4E25